MNPQLMNSHKLFDCSRRSPVITVWLWLCVVVNFFSLVLFMGREQWLLYPLWLSIFIAVVSVAVIYGYFCLLLWRRSGFFLLCGCAVANAIITGMTAGIISVIPPIVSILILFAVLQIRKNGISYWKALNF